MHSIAVYLHRWVGLATALFLAIAGLTGTALVFKNDLESAINPTWFVVAPPAKGDSGFLDPFSLRERVQHMFPEARADYLSFPAAGTSQLFYLMPRIDPVTGTPFPLRVDQAYLNPYTGELLGARKWGELFPNGKFQRENIVPFIWRLHEALALPFPWGKIFMGIIALLWTFDCFVGLYLTWPRGISFSLGRWAIAWKIKRGASTYRLNLDLHRAAALWLWGLLLVFAWSSVMLNLRSSVYKPVMSLAFDFDESVQRRLPTPLLTPALDFRQAHDKARSALDALAREQGFSIYAEDSLWYRPFAGAYLYRTRTSLDVRDIGGATDLWIDGNTGQVLITRFESGDAYGDVVSTWLRVLHIGKIGGWPYRLVVALLGIVITGLGVTGVVIWHIKRRARKIAKSKRLD